MSEHILRRLADRGASHPCIYSLDWWRIATDGSTLLAVRTEPGRIQGEAQAPKQLVDALEIALEGVKVPLRHILDHVGDAPRMLIEPCPRWGAHEAYDPDDPDDYGADCPHECCYLPNLGWAYVTYTREFVHNWIMLNGVPFDRVRIAEAIDGWPESPTLLSCGLNGSLRIEQANRVALVMRGQLGKWDEPGLRFTRNAYPFGGLDSRR